MLFLFALDRDEKSISELIEQKIYYIFCCLLIHSIETNYLVLFKHALQKSEYILFLCIQTNLTYRNVSIVQLLLFFGV